MRKTKKRPPPKKLPKIEKFELDIGRILGGIYEVEAFLGGGYEGEVYRVTEFRTGVPRTAKLFFPHRNEKGREALAYARKLEKLRDCPIVIQYHHVENIKFRRHDITCLISQFVEGMQLSKYIESHPGKRMPPYKALHVIYNLVCGLEDIHWKNEYHGDIHSDNILIAPRGIFFDIKLIDFYNLGRSNKERRKEDIIDIAHLLHEAIGGAKWYAKAPQEVKDVCRGLRRDLILKAFPTTRHLREHLETFL